jgi:hypothetical protein
VAFGETENGGDLVEIGLEVVNAAENGTKHGKVVLGEAVRDGASGIGRSGSFLGRHGGD